MMRCVLWSVVWRVSSSSSSSSSFVSCRLHLVPPPPRVSLLSSGFPVWVVSLYKAKRWARSRSVVQSAELRAELLRAADEQGPTAARPAPLSLSSAELHRCVIYVITAWPDHLVWRFVVLLLLLLLASPSPLRVAVADVSFE